jgi:hypothetical protein
MIDWLGVIIDFHPHGLCLYGLSTDHLQAECMAGWLCAAVRLLGGIDGVVIGCDCVRSHWSHGCHAKGLLELF